MSEEFISRQAAIEAVEPYTDDVYNSTEREIKEVLQSLPPANAVELPCKVGDMLYEPCTRCNCVHEYEVVHFRIIQNDEWHDNVVVGAGRELFFSEIGVTAFLSREEAEAAMRRGGAE